jgi:hypothetical protein
MRKPEFYVLGGVFPGGRGYSRLTSTCLDPLRIRLLALREDFQGYDTGYPIDFIIASSLTLAEMAMLASTLNELGVGYYFSILAMRILPSDVAEYLTSTYSTSCQRN